MIKEFVMHYIFVDFFFFTLFGIMMARKLLWLFSFVSYGGMTLIIFFFFVHLILVAGATIARIMDYYLCF